MCLSKTKPRYSRFKDMYMSVKADAGSVPPGLYNAHGETAMTGAAAEARITGALHSVP